MRELSKSVRKRIWKFRLMICWRVICIVILSIFVGIWLYSPIGMVGYFNESPRVAHTPFSYLSYLATPILLLNFTLLNRNNIVCLLISSFADRCKELKALTESGQTLMRYFRIAKKEQLSGPDIQDIQHHLACIGIDMDLRSIRCACLLYTMII